jgi:hypothetical protein
MQIHSILPAIDCPDPLSLADFYSKLLGYEVEPLNGFPADKVKWIEVQHDGVSVIGFQKVANFIAPTWPEGDVPQQLHLDFRVSDLDVAEAHALSLGAKKTPIQPGDDFRVFLDPVGHPFCFVLQQD